MSKSKRQGKTTACICCGQIGTEGARGLIWPCYSRHRRAGTLEQFRVHLDQFRVHYISADQIVIPIAVLGALLADASPELEEWAEEQLGAGVVTRAINTADLQQIVVSA